MDRVLNWAIFLLLATAITGCRSAPIQQREPTRRPPSGFETSEREPKAGLIQPISHTQDLDTDETAVERIPLEPELTATHSTPPPIPQESKSNHDIDRPHDLEQIQQLALATNPAIAEIDAEIESLKGKLTQAGLPPNPTVGINAEDINEGGGAGRYGVYFGRQVVRGNKLQLSRSVVCAEIEAAKHRREVVVQKLQTDVRKAFFNLLIAQRRIKTIEQLVELSQQAVNTTEKLHEADEVALTAVLQAELELQNAKVFLKQSANQKLGAKRRLASFLGEAELPFDSVSGDIHTLAALDDFERSYDQLLAASPEVSVLFAEVEQQRRNLSRQIAEPIPNLTWQSTLQFDTVTDDLVAGFQIGMPLPRLNQNQGAIYQSQYQIVAAERRAEKKALDLRQRLATAYQDYIDSQIQVEAFENEIIPKAEQTLDLINQAYQAGELPFLQLLTAQRTNTQTQLTYLRQLQILWERHWEVTGMLLSGSLEN